MDQVRAKRIAKEIKGTKVGNWKILDFVDNGKSAVVLKATRSSEEAALKIFDPELIESFGRKTQLTRVQREKDLIDKRHPNLIEIKDGGECKRTGYIFVAMAYLERKNLARMVSDLPRDHILPIISQIASAAKFLEDNGLAHRDIKPENVAISDDFDHAILLDLGVLRPVGLSEITDEHEQKAFVGTLRYSPPELVYRKEKDSLEGWRAITFYQLGAVLHDMIMRCRIFHDFGEPYAKLVDAVREMTPEIKADDVDSDLIILARSCLVKDPQLRLSIVSWDHFLKPPLKEKTYNSFRERIIKRKAIIGDTKGRGFLANDKDRAYKRFLQLEEIVNSIKDIIRETCLNDRECFPRFQIDQQLETGDSCASIFVCFSPSHPHHLFVAVTLVVFISLSNEPDNILNLGYVTLASHDCIREFNNADLKIERLFIGPYKPDIIKNKIKLLLLAIMDKGQEIDEEEKILPPIQLIFNMEHLEEDPQ